MPSTAFISPTTVRSMSWDGGSGEVANEADILTGGFAIFTLPDGSTYTPGSAETAAGHVLPIAVFQSGYNFASVLPANAVVTGITIRTKVYSENIEGIDQNNYYRYQFTCFPSVVPQYNEIYNWLQYKYVAAVLDDAAQKTLGGSTDTWQPQPCLTIDGMYLYSTDSGFHGYEVKTSEIDPFAYDFFYDGHDLIIQPTTQGYSTATMEAESSLLDYTGLVGKTITLTVPNIGDFTLTGQAGAVTPGTAFFQAATGHDETGASITNQFSAYSNGFGNVSDYVSISFFQDVVWQWTPNDVGTATNLFRLTTSAAASVLLFPNDGYFSGGGDPNPNASTMGNENGANLINTVSGAPMIAQVVPNAAAGLEITNTLSHFALSTSVPASVFRGSAFGVDFGISSFYDWTVGSTANPLLYPQIPDNTQKLGKTTISLTYSLSSGNARNLLLLGVG